MTVRYFAIAYNYGSLPKRANKIFGEYSIHSQQYCQCNINKDKNKEEDIIYSKFPITSLENLNELDHEVKQLRLLKVDVYDALVKNLSLIGGSSFGELLRRILKKVLTDEIAEQYSWFGHQKKLSFAKTSFVDLIKSAVKLKYKEETDKNLESLFGTWLAKAKERMKTPSTTNNL